MRRIRLIFQVLRRVGLSRPHSACVGVVFSFGLLLSLSFSYGLTGLLSSMITFVFLSILHSYLYSLSSAFFALFLYSIRSCYAYEVLRRD